MSARTSHITASRRQYNILTAQPYNYRFPAGIPSGTVVPGWAFEDVTKSDIFSVSTALADNSPESSSVTNSPSSTSSATNSGTASVSSDSTQSSSSASSEPTGSSSPRTTSHVGAIAGGVVGGIVGIAGLSALAFFLGRRHQRASAATAGPDWPVAPITDESAGTKYTPPNSDAQVYDSVRLYVSD